MERHFWNIVIDWWIFLEMLDAIIQSLRMFGISFKLSIDSRHVLSAPQTLAGRGVTQPRGGERGQEVYKIHRSGETYKHVKMDQSWTTISHRIGISIRKLAVGPVLTCNWTRISPLLPQRYDTVSRLITIGGTRSALYYYTDMACCKTFSQRESSFHRSCTAIGCDSVRSL